MSQDTPTSERTSRILDPSFLEGLDDLSTEVVRARRDETLAERDYQSYLRRLIQARQDLLVAERDRRAEGAAEPPLVERLTQILSAGPQGGSRGEVLRVQLPPEDITEAERSVGAVMGASFLARPEALSAEDLDRMLEALDRAEHAVSAVRSAVFVVHDRLQEELKRRYRRDPSEIPSHL